MGLFSSHAVIPVMYLALYKYRGTHMGVTLKPTESVTKGCVDIVFSLSEKCWLGLRSAAMKHLCTKRKKPRVSFLFHYFYRGLTTQLTTGLQLVE